MAILLPSSPSKPPQIPLTPNDSSFPSPSKLCCSLSRRGFAFSVASFSLGLSPISATAIGETPRKPALSKIASTRSWFQFFGDGFSIRVPPLFEDIMEPEDFNAGMTLYGDKAKPRPFAARFASPDRSETLSVVIRPSNQLRITFLEAKDITDLGSLKQAAKIFVPGGASLYSAQTIKIKEDGETLRTYYFYEFGIDDQHIFLVAAVNSGKTYVAGATAPQTKWEDDGIKLRSAAISLSLL